MSRNLTLPSAPAGESPGGPFSMLLVTPDFPPASGGIQRLTSGLVESISGVDCSVVTMGGRGTQRRSSATGVDVLRVGRRGGPLHKASIVALNAVGAARARACRPQVVVSAHVTTAPAALAAKRIVGSKTLQYLHADEFHSQAGLTRFAIDHADALVAVSRHTREMALAAGAAPERVRVITPGVDPPPRLREAAPAETPTLITVSRLVELYKGHDTVIRALALVRAQIPDVRWIVVGDGPLRPALASLAASAGVAGAVHFLGAVDDRERDRWLEGSHVFVMPSRLSGASVGGEGFGIAYLEASIRGLPVVAGAVGGALDSVVDAETGLLVDPTDHVELAAAIVELLSDPRRAAALGDAGARRAQKLTWERHAGAVKELMLELTAGR